MKKITLIITLALSFMTGTACAAEWVNISGSVYCGSQPLNAMVLANGQHMFTDPGDGIYSLSVPLNDSGEIILFSFCDGFAPFRQIMTPQEAEHSEISMTPVSPDSMSMSIRYRLGLAVSGRVRISGTVLHDETPLCAVVLANGQHTFSCAGKGEFELEVPPDEKGEITLLGFCEGFAPFRHVMEKSDPDPDFKLRGGVYDGSEIHRDRECIVAIGGASVSLFPAHTGHETSSAAVPVTGLHTYTDESGAYRFSALPAGEYECNMIVEAEGYEQWEGAINIARGRNSQSVVLMPAITCYENNECPGDLYCSKFLGDCDGKGMCSEMFSPYYFEFDFDFRPMCGCDGWTYMSPCNAGEVGINMAYYYNTLDNISPGDPCVSSSEGGTVSGYVYEESATCVTENCVLPNIHVLAEQILSPDSKNRPRRTSVRTDENGFYKFPVLPVGEYKIFVTRGVYQAWESLVSITRGEETLQDVYLTPVIAESVLRDTHR